MTDKIVRTVPLPEKPENVPTVSLHLLAKNAENVLSRLFDNILPFVQEATIILNDTDDASETVIDRYVDKYQAVDFLVRHVDHATHPLFYFFDEHSSYEVDNSLSGETFEGPFTNAPLLCDWAAVRNLGWASSCDWRLFLDADDVVTDPQKLPGLLKVLGDMRADLAATKYAFGFGGGGTVNSASYRERLARNVPSIIWEGKTHEILTGGIRHVLVEDCFAVTDLKDNWGKGVRVPGRCFKVLYRDARLAHWEVSPRHLAYLVQECPGMMPLDWVSGHLVPFYFKKHQEAEELSWVYSMVGEMFEAKEDYLSAITNYLAAVACYPSAKAWFRLCRARFMTEEWAKCIEAYEFGKNALPNPQILDMGPVYEHSSKLLVAQAYFELGDKQNAIRTIDEAMERFSGSSTVIALRDKIHGF